MASLATVSRLSSRVAGRRVAREAVVRGYKTSSPCLAASNFTMPALSPTMTEGNIASWKLKEGDSYAAGDVLLEIETDKATMDVEAQEDGILMKITQANGAKGVEIGSRIAVTAEPGDDISTLEMPPDKKAAAAPEPKGTPSPSSIESTAANSPRTTSASRIGSTKAAAPQTYPLFPAVKQLMKQEGIEESEISKMAPTGPKGRLLKGDVLAYLGIVTSSKTESIQARFNKLSHLDLSDVKVAAPIQAPKKAAPPPAPLVVEKLQVAMPISLAPVLEAQKRLRESLGIDMPLSYLITRATDLANDDLPLPANYGPTADELFNQVIGLGSISKGSRGFYLPQITALPHAEMKTPRPVGGKKADIIDILASSSKRRASKPTQVKEVVAFTTGTNIFTLSVPKAEEKRANVFLERVKVVLENEPGRLLL